jgi:putative DNA primase/helicase
MLETAAANRPNAATKPALTTAERFASGPDQDNLPVGPLPPSLSDRGNARLFAELHRERFRHVEGLGWLSWDGHRWRREGGRKAAIWAAGEMAERMPDSDPHGVFSDRVIAHHKRRTLSTAGMKALLAQAKAAPELSVDADQLDGDPYALCTPAGVVDLRNGHLRRADPARDLHSRATSVTPHTMKTPRWHRFLGDTFGQDAEGREMIDFLHLLLGYSITGDVGAQVLPFLHGEGKNGKSVLLDTMVQVLGDYADAASPGFLTERGAAEHSTALTELHGRRLVVCSELSSNDKFDEARVRLLTGGDRIKARRMHQDYFSFSPTHHLWLLGNHRPEVTTGGFAFWRRIRLIPCTRTVPADRKIDNLAFDLVRDEGPGILQWLIEGAQRYLATRDPLRGPGPVTAATTAYATAEDHIGRFLSERCTRERDTGHGLRVEQGLLHSEYTSWSHTVEGIRPATPRAFAQRVRQEVGLASPTDMIKSNGRRYYPGIALLPR